MGTANISVRSDIQGPKGDAFLNVLPSISRTLQSCYENLASPRFWIWGFSNLSRRLK